MSKRVIFKPTPKQAEFQNAIISGKYSRLLYGGSVRVGKTLMALNTLTALCRIYKGSRWVVVRKSLPDLKLTSIKTFQDEIITEDGLDFLDHFSMGGSPTAYFKNGSEIVFFSENFARDKDLNRFRGLAASGFLGEEINELQYNTYQKMCERAGGLLKIPVRPKPFVMGTCNPNNSWIKKIWYNPWKQGILKPPFYFMQALPKDNPYIPEDQWESWNLMDEQWKRTYIDGDWESADDLQQLISWACIDNAEKEIKTGDENYYLGVDPAGMGDDKCVFILMKGNNIVDIFYQKKTRQNDVYDKVKYYIDEYKIDEDHIAIDGVGLGAGVIDFLLNDGIEVINFKGGANPIEDDTSFVYKDIRSQGYWLLKQAFENEEIGGVEDMDLKEELASIWYDLNGEKNVKVEGKKDIKKRLGHSPDYADALMYANWARIHNELEPAPGVFFV